MIFQQVAISTIKINLSYKAISNIGFTLPKLTIRNAVGIAYLISLIKDQWRSQIIGDCPQAVINSLTPGISSLAHRLLHKGIEIVKNCLLRF